MRRHGRHGALELANSAIYEELWQMDLRCKTAGRLIKLFIKFYFPVAGGAASDLDVGAAAATGDGASVGVPCVKVQVYEVREKRYKERRSTSTQQTLHACGGHSAQSVWWLRWLTQLLLLDESTTARFT
jgi:hypothetical protein